MNTARRFAAVLVPLAVLAASCGGSDDSDGDERARTIEAPESEAPKEPEGGGGGGDKTLSEAELKAALLTVQDLPTGYTLDTSPDEDDDETQGSSEECSDRFEALTEAEEQDDTTEAEVSFEGGLGVVLEQGLESYPDEEIPAERFDQVVEVLNDCPSFTSTEADGTNTEFTISPLSFPKLGDDTIALNIKVKTSEFDGVLNFAVVRLGRNVMSIGQGGLTADAAVLEQVARKGLEKLAGASE